MEVGIIALVLFTAVVFLYIAECSDHPFIVFIYIFTALFNNMLDHILLCNSDQVNASFNQFIHFTCWCHNMQQINDFIDFSVFLCNSYIKYFLEVTLVQKALNHDCFKTIKIQIGKVMINLSPCLSS